MQGRATVSAVHTARHFASWLFARRRRVSCPCISQIWRAYLDEASALLGWLMAERLVTVGDVVVDILLETRLPVEADAHYMTPTLLIEPGGACSTLLAARNLGLDGVALGAVGDDAQGLMLVEMLAEAGIDVSALVVPPGSGTTMVVVLSDPQDPAHVFLGKYGESPPIPLTRAALNQLERADVVYMSGYSVVEQRLAPLVEGVLEFIENSPTPLYIDVGPFLGQLEQARVERVLRAADLVMLTEEEIRHVAAGESDVAACRRMIDAYPDLRIVLKLGAAGCHLLAQDLDVACPGFPAAAVVDTIGAGDAFAAAYIWAELRGYSPAECGTIGNAMGAASVMKAGAGRNVPTRAEAQRVLDENGTGITLR